MGMTQEPGWVNLLSERWPLERESLAVEETETS